MTLSIESSLLLFVSVVSDAKSVVLCTLSYRVAMAGRWRVEAMSVDGMGLVESSAECGTLVGTQRSVRIS
jgi:hypothetical protein